MKRSTFGVRGQSSVSHGTEIYVAKVCFGHISPELSNNF